jgi:hypothetical protein
MGKYIVEIDGSMCTIQPYIEPEKENENFRSIVNILSCFNLDDFPRIRALIGKIERLKAFYRNIDLSGYTIEQIETEYKEMRVQYYISVPVCPDKRKGKL